MGFALATFNVKNLLEPRDERERAIFRDKLDGVARVLHACDADVVALQEVGPPRLVCALTTRLAESGADYGATVIGTADTRGIRCALLSRVGVVRARVHTAESLAFPVFCAGDPAPFGERIPLRRGVVHARIDVPAIGAVDIVVVHFKSPLPVRLRDARGAEIEEGTARAHAEGAARSLVWRAAEALYVRSLVDEMLAADPFAAIAVAGDLNDLPESSVLRVLRGDGLAQLFDCTAGLDRAARFSVLHGGQPFQVDHVLATGRLHARVADARFLNGQLRDHGPFSPGSDEPPTVDSDHAALVVRFA